MPEGYFFGNLPNLFGGGAPDPNMSPAIRIKIAELLARKRAFPNTLGQGLSAIGDALGDRALARQLEDYDKAQQEQANATFAPPSSPQAPTATPQRSSYDTTDGGATRAVTPTASLTSGPGDIPVYDPKNYNPLDQQSDLQDQRKAYVAQLEKDPQAMTKMAGLMSAEEGPGAANSSARQALAETIFNRGISRGVGNINQVMDPRYYQPMQPGQTNKYSDHVARLQSDPAYRAQVESEIRQAGAGGNVSNLATDNASGGVAQRSMGNQTLTYTAPNQESFFRKDIRPDVHGAGVVPATAAWANRLTPMPPQAMVAQQQGAPQPGVMAFDGTPTAPQIRQAPQPQIAQAPNPAYVTPDPGQVPMTQMTPITPREKELTDIIAQYPYNARIQARAKMELEPLQAARTFQDKQNAAVAEKNLGLRNDLVMERQRQLATAAERQQKYDLSQQKFIAGDGRPPSPENQAKLGTPQSPQRTGIPTPPPPPPGVIPEKWAEVQAPMVAKAQEAYDKARPAFDDMINLLEQAKAHPGREWGIGGSSKLATQIPGTEAYGFGRIMDQIRGKNFLQAYQILKGGGSITEIEGAKSENAQARIDPMQKEDDFNKAMADFENSVRRDYEQIQRKMHVPVTAWIKPGQENDPTKIAPDIGQRGIRKGVLKEYIGGDPSKDPSYRDISQ